MGKALVLFDADYSNAGIGVATYVGPSDLQAIVIHGPSIAVGTSKVYSAIYYPQTASHSGVTWSISSGGSYASISSNGVLTIDSSASSSQVVIVATSVVDSSIFGTKTVTVSYSESSDTLWDTALEDTDFAQYMTGMTKRFELEDAITKDGTTAANAYTNPITSASQSYVILFDATFPAQVNTDNPLLFARLGIGAALAGWGQNFWFFLPNFGNASRQNIGIPKGENYRAKMLIYYNGTTTAFVKNLVNGQTYSFTAAKDGTTLYDEFYLGGAGTSANYYNGTIYEFIVGTP